MCLAKNIETLFKSTLIEIYGCTETGAVAMRRTAMEEHWQLIKGLKPSHQDDEYYIEDTQSGKIAVLPDVVEWHSENSFSLIARKEDNINIAGKRSSKLYLTKCLNAIEGVQDAVVYIPKTEVDIARIIALVVAPLISEQVIKNELQNSVDNLFMPRQIIKVNAIPRNEAGKVTQQELLNLILACSEQQAVFKIDKSHPALPGHFPNNPLVPGVVTLDNIIACFRQISPEFKLRQLIQIKFHEKLRAEQRCVVKFSLHRKGVQFKAFVKQKLVISGIFNL
jgi:acyl-coenzyme A synthetase/AMP-(fatty) acid ligase